MSYPRAKTILGILIGTIIFIAPFGIQSLPAWGADLKDMVSKDKKAPVHITSDNLEADNKAHTITFVGNVVAKREDATLYADKMIVYLNEQMDTMIKIETLGNVRVNQKDRFATGEKGEYWDAEQKIILTGNPKVWQGDNVVTGEIIEFYMKEEKAKALRGEDKRVTAIIIPGKGLSLPGAESSGKPAAKKEDKATSKEDKAGKKEDKAGAKDDKGALMPSEEKKAAKEDKRPKKEGKEVKDMININKATKEELIAKFPGLEEKKIGKIIENRPYKAPLDLVKKGILDQKEWELVRDYATVK